jgi:hypothetical protein
MRLDGKYYCVIFQHGVPLAIAFTDDYDTEEEAIEAAKEVISVNRNAPNPWGKG